MNNATHILPQNTQISKGINISINPNYQGKPHPYETGRMVSYKGKMIPEVLIDDQPALKWFADFNDAFTPYTVTVDDLARAIGKGHAIAPVCKKRRKVANFVSADHIGLDFDTETDACRLPTLAANPFIAQYAAIIHTTSSHTDEKPRARVLFLLDETVTDPAELTRYIAALLARFDLADQKASDPARCFFGAVGCDLRILNEGRNRLPVALLREMADQYEAELAASRPPSTPYTPPASEAGADRARKYGIAALAGITDRVATAPNTTRHTTLYASARKCAVLVREGLISTGEARAALEMAARAVGLDESDWPRTIRDGLNKGAGDSADWLPDFDANPDPAPVNVQIIDRRAGSVDTPHTTDPDLVVEVIDPPRHHDNGLPTGYRELLCNWHNNGWVIDAPALDGYLAYLEARNDLIVRGVVTSAAALTFHEVADLNRFGLSYKALSGLSALPTELFTFLFPYVEDLNTGKEKSTITGRPAKRYQLPVIAELWDRFFAYFRPQMWRALLVDKYPDLPVDLLNYDDVLIARGLGDYDAIGAINDTIHPLLVEYDDRLREAQKELDWRIEKLRSLYIDTPPAPYALAPGVTFSKPSQLKDLHLAITLQRDDGEIQDRYAAARAGGWTLPAYRAALKRAGKLLDETIVTTPNFTERGTITSEVESVTLACEAISQNAYMRGRIKLHAPDGESVTVSPGYARYFDYDEWLADHGGKADVHVWDHSVDKLQKLETPQEAANRQEVSKRQQAINSRRDYDAEKEARAEREQSPSKVDQWVDTQGAMIAPLFGIEPDAPGLWAAIFERAHNEQETPPADTETVIEGIYSNRTESIGSPGVSRTGADQRGASLSHDRIAAKHDSAANESDSARSNDTRHGVGLSADHRVPVSPGRSLGHSAIQPRPRIGRKDYQQAQQLVQEGETMPASHHNEPAEPVISHDPAAVDHHDDQPVITPEPVAEREKLTGSPTSANRSHLSQPSLDGSQPVSVRRRTDPAPQGAACDCCGQPATVTIGGVVGGDFCDVHAALPVRERCAVAIAYERGQKFAPVRSTAAADLFADAAR